MNIVIHNHLHTRDAVEGSDPASNGMAAFLSGLERTSNPYPSGSKAYKDWLVGYERGEKHWAWAKSKYAEARARGLQVDDLRAVRMKLKGKVCDPAARADAISFVVNTLLTRWTNNPHEKDTVRELVRYLAYHCELTVTEAAQRVVVLLKTRRSGPPGLTDAVHAAAA